MAEKTTVSKKGFSADWLMRGVLTKLGDSFDKLTGRKWTPSSSLAASELIERIKKLLDAEAREVPGKGKVVPHNIKLKMQWNKFSEDSEDAIRILEIELLTAAVDHINDSLYYTYAPVTLEVKPDYFIEGVKLTVSFEDFEEDEGGVEMNVTVPAINVSGALAQVDAKTAAAETYVFRYEIKGEKKEKQLQFAPGHSLSVGRIGANAFVLDDASVSKTHASLAVGTDGCLSVADTGSTNGTFINDERISYGKAVKLEAADRIKFGTVEVTFEHVPRPVVLEEEVTADSDGEDTVSIDGFEFKRGVSPEAAPEQDDRENSTAAISPEDIPEVKRSNTSPAIAMPDTPIRSSPDVQIPDETLKIEPAAGDKRTSEDEEIDLDATIRDGSSGRQ